MNRLMVLILVTVALCTAGCLTSLYREPTVTVEGISIENVSLSRIDLLVQLNVSNPNPLGATLERVSFDLYFLQDGQKTFLGHGERGGFEIPPRGSSVVTVPVTLDTGPLVQAFLLALRDGTIRFVVEGSATVDLGVTTFEVPFSQTMDMDLQRGS